MKPENQGEDQENKQRVDQLNAGNKDAQQKVSEQQESSRANSQDEGPTYDPTKTVDNLAGNQMNKNQEMLKQDQHP